MRTTFEDSIDALNEFIHIPVGNVLLEGELRIPSESQSMVIFAHPSRHSQQNTEIAEELARAGFGTLLMDLLTPDEQRRRSVTGVRRFDIELLARRLSGVIRWLDNRPLTCALDKGCVSTGIATAATLIAAAEMRDRVAAIVSRGGRPDLAGEALGKVRTPTLLIVGGAEEELVLLNEDAYAEMRWRRDLKILPGATRMFREPGKLMEVARLGAGWFARHMGSPIGKR